MPIKYNTGTAHKKLVFLHGMGFLTNIDQYGILTNSPCHHYKLNIYQVQCYKTRKNNVLMLSARFPVSNMTGVSFHRYEIVLPSTSLLVLHSVDIKLTVMEKLLVNVVLFLLVKPFKFIQLCIYETSVCILYTVFVQFFH